MGLGPHDKTMQVDVERRSQYQKFENALLPGQRALLPGQSADFIFSGFVLVQMGPNVSNMLPI